MCGTLVSRLGAGPLVLPEFWGQSPAMAGLPLRMRAPIWDIGYAPCALTERRSCRRVGGAGADHASSRPARDPARGGTWITDDNRALGLQELVGPVERPHAGNVHKDQ